MPPLRDIIAIGLAVLFLASNWSTIIMPWWWTFGSVPELTPQELHDIISSPEKVQGFQILDVRTETEYKGGHIAGAVSCSFFPPHSFPERVKALNLDPTKPTIAICLSAHRSISAVKYLKQQDFAKVEQLQGGMKAWRAQQLPEVKQ
eukprot:Colp12_sorted_trinity150504_noHs@22550